MQCHSNAATSNSKFSIDLIFENNSFSRVHDSIAVSMQDLPAQIRMCTLGYEHGIIISPLVRARLRP